MRSRREGERNKVHDVPVSVSQGAHDARVVAAFMDPYTVRTTTTDRCRATR